MGLIIVCMFNVCMIIGMASVISTERCIIRPIELSDQADIFSLRSNEQVTQFLNIARVHKQADESLKLIEFFRQQYTQEEGSTWLAVEEKKTHKVFGIVGFLGYSKEKQTAELFFFYLPSYWGKLFAYEVAQAMIAYAFETLKVQKITATADPENERSIRLLTRLGFKFVELKKAHVTTFKGKRDRNIYCLACS